MSDIATRRKWDRAARSFDLMTGIGPDKRWEPAKRALFGRMGQGEILFLAIGTGLDIPFFRRADASSASTSARR